jgi:benzodiazapine receptor
MKTQATYRELRKPTWAPPAWLFGPVWTVLYVLIAISFGYVIYQFTEGKIALALLLPFILNLIFNILFTPIQFGLKSNALASLDVLLVLATLVWAMYAIYAEAPWVAYVNIPYLAWVCFASTLQLTITFMNRKM